MSRCTINYITFINSKTLAESLFNYVCLKLSANYLRYFHSYDFKQQRLAESTLNKNNINDINHVLWIKLCSYQKNKVTLPSTPIFLMHFYIFCSLREKLLFEWLCKHVINKSLSFSTFRFVGHHEDFSKYKKPCNY